MPPGRRRRQEPPAREALLGEAEVENPDQQIVRTFLSRIRERYDLDEQQVRDLRAILLQGYHDRMRIFATVEPHQLPPEIQSRRLEAQRQMDRRIEQILNPEQRASYRRELGRAEPDGSGGRPKDE